MALNNWYSGLAASCGVGFGGTSGLDYLTQSQIGLNAAIASDLGTMENKMGGAAEREGFLSSQMGSDAFDHGASESKKRGETVRASAVTLYAVNAVMTGGGYDTGERVVIMYNPDGSETHVTYNENNKDVDGNPELVSVAYRSASYIAENSGSDFSKMAQIGSNMTFPAFSTLLINYPELTDEDNPFHPSNDNNFSNQCAARMSMCLMNSCVDMTSFKGSKSSDGYAKGAKSLGNWIRENFSKPVELTPETFKDSKYQKQTGILLIFNPDDKNQSGHIDLWHPGMINDPYGTKNQYYGGGWSTYKIWFWPIK